MTFHPWRALRALPRVEVFWKPLVGARRAATDGAEVIVMRPGLSQVQRRCTLAHELAHIELGHTDGASPRDERAADQLAARRLIPMDRLLDVLRWAEELEEVADELWVDVPTLMARLDGLTCIERDKIKALYDAVERGC